MDKKYKTIFMGTPQFAVASLEALIKNGKFNVLAVVTQPDKPQGRNKATVPSPIKKTAQKNNITVLTPDKIRGNNEFIQQINNLSPDVIVVVAYGKILPQELLNIPKYGAINLHGSILPKYRGASPIVASILAGDKETGITMIKMDAEMDAGPIISINQPIEISSKDTIISLSQKLSQAAADLLIKDLPAYLAGVIQPKPQNETGASYVKLIKKEDGLIDWSEDAKKLNREIKAYLGWPSSYTYYQDKQLKILEADVIEKNSGNNGEIWETEDHYPAVYTGKGSLKLIQLQLAGKKPVSGKDFIRGYSDFIGYQFN
jgi:methionyl-tRNA formyltransferase